MKEPLFIETMRIENGAIAHLEHHVQRMQTTCSEVWGYAPDGEFLHQLSIPADAQKCRLVYGRTIQSVAFDTYQPRSIRSLKMVEAPSSFDYHLKYADRSALNALATRKGACDDVLIIRNGWVTDTSFSNVVFTDGKDFVTPETPLLAGTMRRHLLDSGVITEAPLTPSDLSRFTHVTLINAMLPWGSVPFIPVTQIFPAE